MFIPFLTSISLFSRLAATSWNLASNISNDIIGFSGTNDNHRILPLQVRQYFASRDDGSDPVLRSLDGTNGKMLDMILEHTEAVHQLQSDTKLSDSLVDLIREGMVPGSSLQMMHAIIDCGALLAGIDLLELSRKIISFLPMKDFGGVLFYDCVKTHDWVILEKSGRLLPKNMSPIKEENTFAIFDEPRCRGTDLRLRSDTIALLTLAPRLCKDKLMQAAGRLRKFGCNQKLVIAGGSDVFSKLGDDMTAASVLAWTMENTVEATATGLPNWVNQGIIFTSTFGKDPKLSIMDEQVELKDMYGKSFVEETVDASATKAHRYHIQRTGGEAALHYDAREMVDQISKRACEYGPEIKLSTKGGYDEECEREVELEIEEEEEVEEEVPLMDPFQEKNWDFEKALLCQSPDELPVSTTLLPSFVVQSVAKKALAKVNWEEKIYLTANFLQTVACQDGDALDCYLRAVNSILRFPNKSLLLLSEFEANHMLKIFWNSNTGSHHLMHSCLLRHSFDRGGKVLLQCTRGRIMLKAKDTISEKTMASLQYFSGETTYATKSRKDTLKALLRVRKSNRGSEFCPLVDSQHLVGMRGLENLYPYSDLEAVGHALISESV